MNRNECSMIVKVIIQHITDPSWHFAAVTVVAQTSHFLNYFLHKQKANEEILSVQLYLIIIGCVRRF